MWKAFTAQGITSFDVEMRNPCARYTQLLSLPSAVDAGVTIDYSLVGMLQAPFERDMGR